MAITALTPAPADRIPDPVTFKEVALLLRETGQPEFTECSLKALENKLYRWAREDALPMEPRGKRGKLVVSYSDLLVAHATRYPPPGAC